MRKTVFAVIIAAVIALLLCSAQAETVAQVAGGRLKVRSAPGGTVIDYFPNKTLITVKENQGTWSLVSGPGVPAGYVMTEFLSLVGEFSAHDTGKVKNDHGTYVNMRNGAGYDGDIIGRCNVGARVEILGEKQGWYLIRDDGVIGYMDAGFIEKTAGAESTDDDTYSSNEYPLLFVPAEQTVSHGWGEEQVLIDYDGFISYNISYPVMGNNDASASIEEWARGWISDMNIIFDIDSLPDGKLEVVYTDENGEEVVLDMRGAMTVAYNSCMADENFVGILEYGTFTWLYNQEVANSSDVIYAVNMDLRTGKTYTGRELFRETAPVYDYLQSQLKKYYPDEYDENMCPPAEDWLENAVLTPEGVLVILAEGYAMPVYAGSQQILIPYGKLNGNLNVDVHPAPEAVRAAEGSAQYTSVPVHIDPSKPMVALTFDDGPSAVTPRILDILKSNGCHATFFVVGNRVENYADIARRAVEEGNELACHTWSHVKMTNLSSSEAKREINRSAEAIYESTGYRIKYLRPPYGSYNKTIRSACGDLDIVIINWSLDTEDWKTRNAASTFAAVKSQVKNGSIILCHDLYGETADAVALFVPWLIQNGYQVSSVEEMMAFHVNGLEKGVCYTHLDPKNIVIP